MLLADDFLNYGLQALMIQETHLKGHGVLNIKSTCGKNLKLYYSGNDTLSRNGVGIIVPNSTKCSYLPISYRIIMVKVENEKITINLISAYCPTNDNTRKKIDDTIKFYDSLTDVIKTTKEKESFRWRFECQNKVPKLSTYT